MTVGIIGSGIVGQTLGTKLIEVGEDVVLGTRSPDRLAGKRGQGAPLQDWLAKAGGKGRIATFAEATEAGEVVINATAGVGATEALSMAGSEHLQGKILIDVANPLDFSHGMPPALTVCNTDSLGEQIQRAFPNVRVVKALNTMTAAVMVNPAAVAGGDHDVFICGNDAAAKRRVSELLGQWFGWRNVQDLGDISAARGTEMLLPIWLHLHIARRRRCATRPTASHRSRPAMTFGHRKISCAI